MPQYPSTPVIITSATRDTSHLVNQLNTKLTGILGQTNTGFHGTVTIAQLNALGGMTSGDTAFVSNGLVATGFGNIVAGTGAVQLPVHYDGTNWRYG